MAGLPSATDDAPSVEESLAWEAQWAPRAAIAAILAGLLSLAGFLLPTLGLKDAPQVTISDGLRDIAENPNPGVGARRALYLHDHATVLTAGQILTALSTLLAVVALGYLLRAARARRPQISQALLIALVAGGVASAVGLVVSQIALDLSLADFASAADRHTAAANDALTGGAISAGQYIGLLGVLAFAIAIVMVSLNAMRTGLLTRFMGIVGVLAGILPIVMRVPIIQAFWLIGLGVLFLRRMPTGLPPAWETGRAEPWPTRQQVLEQQGKLPAKGGAPAKAGPPPAADPLGAALERSAHPRSKKKKRRR